MLRKSSLFVRSYSRAILHLGRISDQRGTAAACEYQGKTAGVVDAEWEAAKPYELIPGPKPIPILGNIPRFLPVIGKYGKLPLLDMINRLREDYGDVVKLEGIPGRRRCVFLFDPNDCEMVYRTEGPWPWRISMEAIQRYRERKNMGNTGGFGLVSVQGEQWHRFRTKVNQHLMQPKTIWPHVQPIDKVASDFIEKIRKLRTNDSLEMPASFNNEMNKWALESICTITLNHRVGCLDSNLASDSEPQILINSVHSMFDLMYKLEILPSLWKLYDTRNLKKFYEILDRLTMITKKYVTQAKQRLAENPAEQTGERSLLDKLIGVDEETATTMMMDMLIAGVDTTSNSASTALYYIATNPEVQDKLRVEAMSVLPKKTSPVTIETLDNIPYLRAVIKESMRMMPVGIGNLRTTITNVVIGGYKIPKSEDVIMCHTPMSHEAQHFPDPTKFLPDRWLREFSSAVYSAKKAHPFVYMPFGFGPRTCIGRRFAQLEMETLLIKMVRNFRLEWNYGTLKYKSGFINTVESPLKLKMIDIER